MRSLGLIVLGAVAFAACGGTPPASTAKATPAAKVQNPKSESDLTTITLSEESEKHLALTIAETAMQPVRSVRTVGGEVVVPAGQTVSVSAPLAGTLSLPAGRTTTIGPVSKGTVLFELLPLQPADRDARIIAERNLKEAVARLDEASQRLMRLQTLFTEGSASARAVEEARANQAVAKAATDAALSQMAAIERLPIGARGEIALVAPFDGQITAIRVAAGQTIAAGAPVADVADLRLAWLRVPVYAGDVAALDLNRPAAVAELGRELSGPWREARRVTGPPSADANAASVDLFFQLSQAGLRPGERLAVRLALKSSTNERAIVVPASAVVYDLSGGTWVYESKGAHVYARRRVELAGLAGSDLIVRRGLTAGVRIVTAGAAELYGTEFYVSK